MKHPTVGVGGAEKVRHGAGPARDDVVHPFPSRSLSASPPPPSPRPPSGAILSTTSAIWTAISRVGATIKTRGEGEGEGEGEGSSVGGKAEAVVVLPLPLPLPPGEAVVGGGDGRHASCARMEKASVLPVPLLAWTMRSTPVRARGRTAAWTGEGCKYPRRARGGRRTGGTRRSAKVEVGWTSRVRGEISERDSGGEWFMMIERIGEGRGGEGGGEWEEVSRGRGVSPGSGHLGNTSVPVTEIPSLYLA